MKFYATYLYHRSVLHFVKEFRRVDILREELRGRMSPLPALVTPEECFCAGHCHSGKDKLPIGKKPSKTANSNWPANSHFKDESWEVETLKFMNYRLHSRVHGTLSTNAPLSTRFCPRSLPLLLFFCPFLLFPGCFSLWSHPSLFYAFPLCLCSLPASYSSFGFSSPLFPILMAFPLSLLLDIY